MSNRNSYSKYLKYTSVGAEIAASILAPIGLGYLLDDYFDTFPWLILVGCLVGIINVMIYIFRLEDRLNKDK